MPLPSKWPFGEKEYKGVQPPIYYEWKTDKKFEGVKRTKRQIRRDPNHPRWNFQHSLLTWWQIRIKLIGTDADGRRIIVIRPGNGEPIYIRIGNKVELFRAGKKMTWDEDVDETPITAENQRLKGKKRYYAG
jgi:hypothetical protein